MQFVTDFEDILPAKKLESKQRMICIWINRSICLSGASFFKANKLDFCFARAFFYPYYLARVIGRVIKNWDTSPDLLQSMLGANKHELNINKLLNPLFSPESLLLPCFPSRQTDFVPIPAWPHCLKITQNIAFFTNFCPIKTDLSGNTVWPQASGFQKLAKTDHLWHF